MMVKAEQAVAGRAAATGPAIATMIEAECNYLYKVLITNLVLFQTAPMAFQRLPRISAAEATQQVVLLYSYKILNIKDLNSNSFSPMTASNSYSPTTDHTTISARCSSPPSPTTTLATAR